MQHPRRGQRVSIGQMSKAPPRPLLGQHLDQQIEGVDGGENGQQMHAPELRGTEAAATTCAAGLREVLVDPFVGNMWRKLVEQFHRAGDRKQRIHAPSHYPKKQLASAKIARIHFSVVDAVFPMCCCEFPNTL